MFCTECGNEVNENTIICPNCGCRVSVGNRKSWLTTFLLCLFLGGFGAHRFYTGKIGSGIAQLLLTFSIFGTLISAPWVLIDFIMIIVRNFKTKDGQDLI